MSITGYTRKILQYLYNQGREKGNIYGSISFNTGLKSAEKAEELCQPLYANNFVEWKENRVFITDAGCKWIQSFTEQQENRIQQYLYDDYNFTLLRFLYEQELPLRFEEFPEILADEAPKNARGYSSMNLHHMLEIEFQKYIDSSMNQYRLNGAGQKYVEHLAKKNNFSLTKIESKTITKKTLRIFISYAHVNKQWLQKIHVHLKALKNYGQIEFEYWDDTHLMAGDKWESMIGEELNGAEVAVLLISTEFFASDFIKAKELAPLLKNAEAKGTRIIPVIIGHSIFTSTPIGQFQAVNDPSHPLNSLPEPDQEKVLVKMCKDIETHLKRITANK